MTFNPDIHHRCSIRLREYDYSAIGAYFVTVCVHGRECLLGRIVSGVMELSDAGRMVEEVWKGFASGPSSARQQWRARIETFRSW